MSRIALSFIVLLSFGEAWGQTLPMSDQVLFSLRNKPVSADEFIYLYRKNHPGDKPEDYTREKVEEYLDLFVRFKLKVEEARHRKMDTASAFLTEFNGYREELRKPYLPDSHMIDSLVRLTYARLQEEIRASHILIRVAQDASPADTLAAYNKIQALRKRIIEGEGFQAVAAAYSEDQSARRNKGELGYFTALQMVYPFETAAYETPVGKVSDPVRTAFGYHLIYVTDRRPSQGEVEVSHIMLRTGEGYDDDKARTTIFELYDKLQKGMSWADLCSQYSEDQSSRANGGRLKPFGVGTMAMAGIPEFEQIAFGLHDVGQISDPFQTQYGWHIMRLESRKPLAPFEELSASLRNKVSRDERAHLSRMAVQQKMRKEFGFREYSTAKDRVAAMADSTLTRGAWNPEPGLDSGKPLFIMKDHTYTIGDFLQYARQNQKRSFLSPNEYLNDLYEGYVTAIQGEWLEAKIKAENPSYAWLLNEYYEGILLFEIMEREVWSKASDDSVGQRDYYERHRGDYQAGERIQATIYASAVPAQMKALEQLVTKHDSAAVEEFVSKNKVRREQGAFERTDRPVLEKIDWQPGVFVTEHSGLTYLIEVVSILPPGQKTFGEARAAVISDYQDELEDRWIKELKKRYPVRVNRKGKQLVEKILVMKQGT